MPYPSKTSQEKILSAAMEIVEQEGVAGLSLREVARRLELAPMALYNHFADRSELEAEIAAEGFRRLLTVIKRAASRGRGRGGDLGPEAIIRTSLAYLRFARTRPALYQLMFKKHRPTPGLLSATRELGDYSQQLFGWVKSPEVVAEARFALFSLMHGIATLDREGLMEDDRKRDPSAAISALLAGLSQLDSGEKVSG